MQRLRANPETRATFGRRRYRLGRFSQSMLCAISTLELLIFTPVPADRGRASTSPDAGQTSPWLRGPHLDETVRATVGDRLASTERMGCRARSEQVRHPLTTLYQAGADLPSDRQFTVGATPACRRSRAPFVTSASRSMIRSRSQRRSISEAKRAWAPLLYPTQRTWSATQGSSPIAFGRRSAPV